MTTKKILVSSRGRFCKYPDCKRALSIYNHAPYCHVHTNKISADPKYKIPEKSVSAS